MPSYDTEEPLPLPEEILPPRRFFAGAADEITPQTPLPGGTMNAAYPGMQRATTPEQDRFLIQRNEDERYAALGINPVAARRAQAEADERAMQTQGVLEFNQLISGGVTPQEAILRVAPKLTYRNSGGLGSIFSHAALPNAIPDSVNARPIIGQGGARIGDVVYGPRGEMHSARFVDPDKPTPDENAQTKIDKEIRDSLQSRLNALYRSQASGSMGALINTNLAGDIRALESQLDSMRSSAAGRSKASAPDDRVSVSKDGKKGTVPRSKLAEALRQGYKEI